MSHHSEALMRKVEELVHEGRLPHRYAFMIFDLQHHEAERLIASWTLWQRTGIRV